MSFLHGHHTGTTRAPRVRNCTDAVTHPPLRSTPRPSTHRPVESPKVKTCPFCAEEILDAAIVCKHCGRDLRNKGATPLQQVQVVPRTSPVTWLAAGFVALVFSGIFYSACFGTML